MNQVLIYALKNAIWKLEWIGTIVMYENEMRKYSAKYFVQYSRNEARSHKKTNKQKKQ